MPSRAPGEGRYSQVEREQRWVLRELPQERHDPVEILDHYLTGTRLRLRRMQSEREILWKLGQKVRERSDSPAVVRLTNIYLSEREYLALVHLDARVLSKTRWHWDLAGRTVAADSFNDSLAGLVLAEVELTLEDQWFALPPWAVADVSNDDRFSGGALAALSEPGAEALLRVVGQMGRPGHPVTNAR